jgi:hypothetical protein
MVQWPFRSVGTIAPSPTAPTLAKAACARNGRSGHPWLQAEPCDRVHHGLYWACIVQLHYSMTFDNPPFGWSHLGRRSASSS